MGVKKTPIVFRKLGVTTGTAPFTMTARRRLFGLDVGDWSMVFVSLAFIGLLLTLV